MARKDDPFTSEEILLRIEVFRLLESGVSQNAVAEIMGTNQTAVSRMFGEHVKKYLSGK